MNDRANIDLICSLITVRTIAEETKRAHFIRDSDFDIGWRREILDAAFSLQHKLAVDVRTLHDCELIEPLNDEYLRDAVFDSIPGIKRDPAEAVVRYSMAIGPELYDAGLFMGKSQIMAPYGPPDMPKAHNGSITVFGNWLWGQKNKHPTVFNAVFPVSFLRLPKLPG